jgi:hypothetical protein
MSLTVKHSLPTWRKSSYSDGGDNNCVEVATWRKSSCSDGGGTNCVEMGEGPTELVPVRDSKVPDRNVVFVGRDAWAAFLAGVRKP